MHFRHRIDTAGSTGQADTRGVSAVASFNPPFVERSDKLREGSGGNKLEF